MQTEQTPSDSSANRQTGTADRGARATAPARRPNTRVSTARPAAALRAPDDDFHRQVVDNLYDGVYYVDRHRQITYWNKGAERLTGLAAEAIVGRRCYSNLLNHVDESGTSLCRGLCPLAATIRDGEPREADVFLRHRDGHRVPVRVRAAPVRDATGAIIGAVEVFNDGSDLVRARREADEFRGLAMRDQLTGLPNRRHADEMLAAKARVLAVNGDKFGVVIVDVDHFKLVNDRFGHAAGDTVLRNVAQTLASASRHGDEFARWGGEEFVGIIDGVDDRGLRAAAERLRVLCSRTRSMVDGREIDVTVSIGAACVSAHEQLHQALARADAALYEAKARGRNRSVLSRSAGAGPWSMSGAPPITLQLSGLRVDGVEMSIVGGSLISGPGLTERAHWTVIAMVRGQYSAWDRIARMEVTTLEGTFQGDAMVAAAPVLDGGEMRTGLTAFAEGILVPVDLPAWPSDASDLAASEAADTASEAATAGPAAV